MAVVAPLGEVFALLYCLGNYDCASLLYEEAGEHGHDDLNG